MTQAAAARPIASARPAKAGAFNRERVTSVRQFTDRLFSFRTTRDAAFRFENGQFAMIGLELEDRPLLRAYSMASSNYDEELEFYSIKVDDGPLTSRLQHIAVGDTVLVGRKPTGTLVQSSLLPGKRLYLLSTGTGIAPFASIIRDPDVYDRYEQIVLVHGARHVAELQYGVEVVQAVKDDEFLGDYAREKLVHYRDRHPRTLRHTGRITAAIETGKLFADLGAPEPRARARSRHDLRRSGRAERSGGRARSPQFRRGQRRRAGLIRHREGVRGTLTRKAAACGCGRSRGDGLEFGAKMPKPKTPLLTVDAVIFDAQERLLVIRRKNPPFQNACALPGGFVDIGEDVETACRRELLEETGLTVGKLTLVGVYSDPARDPRGHTCSVAFVGKARVDARRRRRRRRGGGMDRRLEGQDVRLRPQADRRRRGPHAAAQVALSAIRTPAHSRPDKRAPAA